MGYIGAFPLSRQISLFLIKISLNILIDIRRNMSRFSGKTLIVGLAKKMLVILGVEGSGRQGIKPNEYQDVTRCCTGSRTRCTDVQNGQLFLSELLDSR